MKRIPIRNEWLGEKVFIIGGGPSLKKIDITKIQGKGRVIATNNAYKIAPFADWILFADTIWYSWHKEELKDVSIPVISGAPANTHRPETLERITNWPKSKKFGTIEEPQGGHLVGDNAGLMALSLAEFLGARVIVLLGFDMNEVPQGESAQWHNDHKRVSNTAMYKSSFIPNFEKTAPILQQKGVYVCNVNPESALKCFEYVPFEDCITND